MYDNNVNNKLVSVIVPVYNAEKFISQTLDSIIKQDYQEKEIIIVDDCSTDNSSQIIKEYMKSNPFIKYHKLDKNSGVAVARNTAIGIAKGRFLAFIDSDDIWEQGKLSCQLKLFDKYSGTPLTYTAISYIDENGKTIKEKRNVKNSLSFEFLLRNTMIATSSVIIDRNVVKEVKMPFRRSGEDYSLWLRILKQYGDAYGLNYPFTRYRKTKSSISSNKVGEVKYFFSVQVEDIGISRFKAGINTMCYIFNALKKHYL